MCDTARLKNVIIIMKKQFQLAERKKKKFLDLTRFFSHILTLSCLALCVSSCDFSLIGSARKSDHSKKILSERMYAWKGEMPILFNSCDAHEWKNIFLVAYIIHILNGTDGISRCVLHERMI